MGTTKAEIVQSAFLRLQEQIVRETAHLGEHTRAAVLRALATLRKQVREEPARFDSEPDDHTT
jgi:hypothetical protein